MTIAPNRPGGSPALHSLDDLREVVDGPVLAGDSSEAAAELAGFQLSIRHAPFAVIGATSTEDVVHAVRWATDLDLPVAVQSTGHGAVQPFDGAVVITTSRMNAVSVDAVEGTATLEAGARWRDVIARSAECGLMPLVGSSSGVGAVGYSLGGGLGLVGRKHGFAADHVRSLQLVTADGVVRHVDHESEPELFFAIRGGKGSFGVVTAMTVGLVPAQLWGGPVMYAGDDAREVLLAYRTWTETLPEEAMTSIALLRVPPLDAIPEPIRGKFVVHLRYTHCGDPAEAEALVAPMLGAGTVLLSMLGPIDPHATDLVHMDPTEPVPFAERGALLADLDESTIDALLAIAGPGRDIPVPVVEIRQLGGALGRPAAVPNAVGARGASWSFFVLGVMAPGLEEVTPQILDALVGAIEPRRAPGAVLNFLGGGAAARPAGVRAAFDAETVERLLAVKHDVDPSNTFRIGHTLV